MNWSIPRCFSTVFWAYTALVQKTPCPPKIRAALLHSGRMEWQAAVDCTTPRYLGGGLKSTHRVLLHVNILKENKNKAVSLFEDHKWKYALRFRPGVSVYILSPFPADLAHSAQQLHMYRNLLPLQSSLCPSSPLVRECSA